MHFPLLTETASGEPHALHVRKNPAAGRRGERDAHPTLRRACIAAAAGTTAGSSTPRSTDDFDTPLEPPLARHASRRPRSGRVAPSRRATRGQPSPRAGGAGAVESLESQWSGVGRVGQARHRRERRAAAGAGLRGASGSPHGSPGAASGPSRVGGSPRSRCSASLLELDSNRRSKQFVSRVAGFAR